MLNKTQELTLGGVHIFSGVHSERLSWNGQDSHKGLEGEILISTPYDLLDSDRCVITLGLVGILDPHGSSGFWRLSLVKTEVVGDDDGQNKSLRVYFYVETHGGKDVAVTDISVSGMIFRGIGNAEVSFNE